MDYILRDSYCLFVKDMDKCVDRLKTKFITKVRIADKDVTLRAINIPYEGSIEIKFVIDEGCDKFLKIVIHNDTMAKRINKKRRSMNLNVYPNIGNLGNRNISVCYIDKDENNSISYLTEFISQFNKLIAETVEGDIIKMSFPDRYII